MENLQKTSLSAGTMGSKEFSRNSAAAMANFERMVGATKAFNIQSVKMNNAVDQFATKLERGQVGLQGAWRIWRQEAQGGAKMLDNLAARQTRLMKSTFIPDPNMAGYSKAITATKASMAELGAEAEFTKIRISALNSVMREIGTGMVNFGKNTQWAGRQLTVGLTMPLVLFGQAASKAYISFDEQMTSMLKVYGAHAVVQSQQTLDTIEKSVTELADKTARTLGVAMTDTVTIAKTFSSIGLEGQNLISATEATTKLMKLGDLQANQAAGSMVSLQNVFKLQGDQIKDAVNFLNAAKHSTSTTMQDIIDAIPRVGPIIQQMGGTYKDFVSFIVAMKESGVPAAQGANAIKSMLASIIKPTAQARKDFQGMGIDLQALASKNANNVMGMVQGLQSSLNALPKAERLKAIEELFGKFQFARVTALMNNLGTAGSQSAKVLELYGQTNDQLAAVAKQELTTATDKTPAAQMAKMKATLQADLIPIGKKFAESFITLAHGIDGIVKGFKKVSDFLGPVSKFLGGLVGKGLAFIMLVGPITMLVGLFVNLAGQIFKMGTFFRMFSQGLKDDGLKGAIAGISNYFEKVDLSVLAAKENTDLFKDSVVSTADAFAALTANVEKLKLQLSYIAGGAIKGPMGHLAGAPMPQNLFSLTPSMPSTAKGKMGGFVRPHMYPGSALRQDWESMPTAQRAMYPNLLAAESQMKPGQFSGTGGYLERGLTAQWKVAPQGVPSLANSIYGTSPAVYGGATGVAKSDLIAKGTEGLIQKHNGIILGIEKADALTTAQLQELFGKTVTKETSLSAEQRAKLEKVLDTVIFEENAFKENMVDHLIQEQAILLSVQETGTTTNVDILINKLKSATQMEEAKRIPAISMAFEQFNSTLTALAMQEITQMRERMMMMMSGMGTGAAAMMGAELQTGVSLAAEAQGIEQMGLATAQDSSMLRQSIAINTGSVPRFAAGGYISGPGGPKDDKIPAMLSQGEYVINADSVSKYGRGTLDALNNGYAVGGVVRRFEDGGSSQSANLKAVASNMSRLERSHVLPGHVGPLLMLPRSVNLGMQSGGISGFEIRAALEDDRAYSLLYRNGLDMGIPHSEIITSIKNLKNELLSNISDGELYANGSFESSVGIKSVNNSIYSEADPFSSKWKMHDQALSLRNAGDFAKAEEWKAKGLLDERGIAELNRAYSGRGGTKGGVLTAAAREAGLMKSRTATAGGLGPEVRAATAEFSLMEAERAAAMAGPEGMMLAMMLGGMKPRGFAGGGKIPAMLSNGEYVLSKEAVDKHGSGFIDGINNGTAKLARGGKIGNRFANSPMNLARGGVIHAAFGYDTRKNAGMRAYSEAVQPMNRAEVRAMSGMGANAAGVNEARMQRALAAQEQAMAQFGMTIKETAGSVASQWKAGAMSAAETISNGALKAGISIQQGGVKLSEYVMGGAKTFATTVSTAGRSAGYGMTPSKGAQQLYPSYSGYRQQGFSPAEAKEMAMAPQPGQPGFIGPMPKPAPGRLARLGGNIKSSMSMKNMSMGKMMGGMIAGQIVGQGLNAVAGNMQEGMGQSAVKGAAMGVQMGAMFGPWGAAIGAGIGGLGGAAMKGITEMRDKMRQAKAGLVDAVTLDTVSIERFGIKIRDLGGFVLDATGHIAKAQTELQKSIDAWKSATDPTVQDALKNLQNLSKDTGSNRGKIKDLAQEKYLTDIQAGMSKKDAKNDIQGYLMAGGVGGMTASGILNQIGKQSSKRGAGTAFNQILTNAAKSDSSEVYGYTTASGYGGASYLAPQYGASSDVVSKAIKTGVTTADPIQFAKGIDEINKKQGSLNETMVNSDTVFKKYQEDLKKTNPDLAKLNQTLKDHGAKASEVYKIDTLVSLGWEGDAAAADKLRANTGLLNLTIEQYTLRSKAATAAQDFVSNAQDKATAAEQASATATTNKTNKLQRQVDGLNTFISTQQTIIDELNKAKTAQDALNASQQTQIDNSATLTDLQAKIDTAQATGDITALTEAQNAYNTELARQTQASSSSSNTSSIDTEISKHQTNIASAQSQVATFETKIKNLGQTATTTLGTVSTGVKKVGDNAASAAQIASDFYEGGKWSDKKSFAAGLATDLSKKLNIPLGEATDLASQITTSFSKEVSFDKDGKLAGEVGNVGKEMGNLINTASGAFVQMQAFGMLRQQMAAHPNATAAQISAWVKGDVRQAQASWTAGNRSGTLLTPTTGGTGGGVVYQSKPKYALDTIPNTYGWSQNTDYVVQPDGRAFQVGSGNHYRRDGSGSDAAYFYSEPGDVAKDKTHHFWAKYKNGWGEYLSGYKKNKKPDHYFIYGSGHKPKRVYATGGLVTGPGTGTSDSIPAMLSNREYVVKASAVSDVGVGLLDAINNRKFNVATVSNSVSGTVKTNANSALPSNSVYNITVNASTNADPDEIARVVMKSITADSRTLSVPRRIGTVR